LYLATKNFQKVRKAEMLRKLEEKKRKERMKKQLAIYNEQRKYFRKYLSKICILKI